MTTRCFLPRERRGSLLGQPWLIALFLVAVPACKGAGEDARECNVNADCASGTCLPDGTCKPASPQDGGNDAIIEDGSSEDGEQQDAPQDVAPDGDPSTCIPNGDGTITAAEMPLGPGFNAMFRVSRNIPTFRSQPDCASGTCEWDLVDIGGVTTEEPSATLPLDGKWYSQIKGFENATYTSRLTEFKLDFAGMTICDQVQFGVFEVNESGLFLLGIVSEFAADGTALVYDKPVPMLVFPMSVGTTWAVDTVARGPLCNSVFDYNISQTYTTIVDKIGRVKTPYGDFENVLRVNTLAERHLGVGVTATKVVTHTYVAECFTTIAAAVSKEGEKELEFESAEEVRRLTDLP